MHIVQERKCSSTSSYLQVYPVLIRYILKSKSGAWFTNYAQMITLRGKGKRKKPYNFSFVLKRKSVTNLFNSPPETNSDQYPTIFQYTPRPTICYHPVFSTPLKQLRKELISTYWQGNLIIRIMQKTCRAKYKQRQTYIKLQQICKVREQLKTWRWWRISL